ncbi:MAG: lysophospholipase [Planctomycetes bacterium]|nr:lysophospholipase [Planctomycetota bacterium]
MPDWLDLVIYFFGSGLAFFVGAGFVLVGVGISPVAAGRALQLTRNLFVLIGVLLVVISAAPLEWWLYAVLAIASCAWLPMEWLAEGRKVLVGRIVVAAAWLLAPVLELPYHFVPTLPAPGNPTLFVIGDSISAGMSDVDKHTWPGIFARAHGIDVRDFSRMGATVGSARKQVQLIGDQNGLVLLEIGGNDLLGTTSADQFEDRLEQLLADVCQPGRTVVMLELPLPPLRNRFGMIQRRLARQYEVILMPRRVLARVLTTTGATVDGIHLSAAGQELMANTMWEILRSGYGAAP